ncbi:MAG: sugar O-acetyltransferase [Eubacteriales bacterium]|nr:sugar O-acetyltransferase [Eubacteriales bacterium]
MTQEEIVERMHSGRLYLCDDPQIAKEQLEWLDRVYDYNHLKPSQQKEKTALLKKMFAHIGEGCYIETPFYANWGGKHVHFGDRVYANFNLTMVDDTKITVGNDVMIGPNVTLCTGTHPVSPRLREQVAQYNLPVTIGNNVWIGGSCVILPGVTIGDHSIIGAGSVVTRDIPDNVVAYGNPCRVRRPITEQDDKIFRGDMPVDLPL